jgi:glycosyltransferase involved in cell wall biosynthesis
MRKLRILWLPADDGGCGHHRVRIWDKAINKLGIADSAILDPGEDEKEVRAAIDSADVVVSRLNTLEYIKLIKQNWPNKVVVFDWDDNTLETKPSNPSYKDFGTQDVWIPMDNPQKTDFYKNATVGTKLKIDERGELPLWVTGITPGFNRFANLEQHTGLLWALQACDLATSPVPTLTEMWSKYADMVAVVVNCLDLSYYPDVEVKRKRKKGEIRVGWSGGSSHSADWKSVMPIMKKLQEKYPKMKLVVAGSYFPENFKDFDVEYHPWTKWEAHPYRMKLLDLDFAIIPLADDVHFNDYKSELKMMEFAALKVPMIVKDQLPYSPYIKKGHNCLAYKTGEELEKCFDIMVEGKQNDKLIDNAYEWVTNERDVLKIAPDLVKLYYSLLPEKTQEKIELP